MITRDKEEVTSDTVQSSDDIDRQYCNKDGNKVRGYSINLPESCDKEEPHLISHVNVRPVSVADNHFLQEIPLQSKWDIEMLKSKKGKKFPELHILIMNLKSWLRAYITSAVNNICRHT